MGSNNRTAAKGCAILAAIVVAVPLLVVGVVGVKTWVPLRGAGQALDELDHSLGSEATYHPLPSGEIPAARLELFLQLRTTLFKACDDYGVVQKGFDSVAALETKESSDLSGVGEASSRLGGAALSITPFLARFFERRNGALLAASMGLQEYAYIYAIAYHDKLMSEQTRNEIFSDGQALSPKASELLWGCLSRQLKGLEESGDDLRGNELATELMKMEEDSTRLVWQDGLPVTIQTSVMPCREQLDGVFCAATAGLEMEQSARRALRVALE